MNCIVCLSRKEGGGNDKQTVSIYFVDFIFSVCLTLIIAQVIVSIVKRR